MIAAARSGLGVALRLARATVMVSGAAWIAVAGAAPPRPDASRVFELIDERLSYMEDVALYKARNDQPVEDRKRESVVLGKAVQHAAELGLDPVSVADFYTAQISAAKAIQYRYRADWLSDPGAMEREPRDLTREIRPALIALGDDIALAIREYLAAGGRFDGERREAFIARIRTDKLTRRDKETLYDALGRIRLLEN